ncbi:hypothetical protein ACFV1T_24925, partial [Streptomyces vinaceus]
ARGSLLRAWNVTALPRPLVMSGPDAAARSAVAEPVRLTAQAGPEAGRVPAAAPASERGHDHGRDHGHGRGHDRDPAARPA